MSSPKTHASLPSPFFHCLLSSRLLVLLIRLILHPRRPAPRWNGLEHMFSHLVHSFVSFLSHHDITILSAHCLSRHRKRLRGCTYHDKFLVLSCFHLVRSIFCFLVICPSEIRLLSHPHHSHSEYPCLLTSFTFLHVPNSALSSPALSRRRSLFCLVSCTFRRQECPCSSVFEFSSSFHAPQYEVLSDWRLASLQNSKAPCSDDGFLLRARGPLAPSSNPSRGER